MWARIDDGLPEHRKLFAAAQYITRAGYARALAMIIQGICYSNRTLSDGFLPRNVVESFHDSRPNEVISALLSAHIWDKCEGGFQIHDYHDYQPKAEEIKQKRERDRLRKLGNQHGRSTGNPDGILDESARNPYTSRARDPIPSRPIPLEQEEQGGDRREIAKPAPAPMNGLRNPHINHACCGKVCLHSTQFSEFERFAANQPDANAYVRAFFATWDGIYQSGERAGEIIGEDSFDFWRSRWSESHPTKKGRAKADELAATDAHTRQKAEIAKGEARRKGIGL